MILILLEIDIFDIAFKGVVQAKKILGNLCLRKVGNALSLINITKKRFKKKNNPA